MEGTPPLGRVVCRFGVLSARPLEDVLETSRSAALRMRAQFGHTPSDADQLTRDLAAHVAARNVNRLKAAVSRLKAEAGQLSEAELQEIIITSAVLRLQSAYHRWKLRHQVASTIQRVLRRHQLQATPTGSMFDASRTLVAWASYCKDPSVRFKCATIIQSVARGRVARLRSATKQALAKLAAQLAAEGFTEEHHRCSSIIQAQRRGQRARRRAAAMRLAKEDRDALLEKRVQLEQDVLEHERHVAEERAEAEWQKALMKEAEVLLRTAKPVDQPCRVERKSVRSGRLFHFQRDWGIPAVDWGNPRIALLPQPTSDKLRMNLPTREQDGCVTELWYWLHCRHPVTSEGCQHVLMPGEVLLTCPPILISPMLSTSHTTSSR